ncbi:MAG: response regulator [Candidatus Pacebacteria bacterium]|nr:response regulator [Candidatus Paceibacterota bacterium]
MSQKILIIEDDKYLRSIIIKKLNLENFQVVEAQDGEEGLNLIVKENPDLVLLDLILPGPINGFEVLSRIKKLPELSSIPVIILSNLGQKEDIDKGLSLGASDYLVKAYFTLEEIVDKVKKIINNKNK